MDTKTGLVFGGGGGRGGYHIGVWKAFRDTGFDAQVNAVSGCSVGSLTAVMFAQGDYEQDYEIWAGLSKDDIMLPRSGRRRISPEIIELNRTMQPEGVYRGFGVYSWLGLLSILHRYCDMARVQASPVEMYTAVTDIADEKGRPRHFQAFRHFFSGAKYGTPRYVPKTEMKSDADLYRTLLASCAIPGVYSAVVMDGRQYYDGGLWETHPLKPLADCGCTDIFVASLYNREPANAAQFRSSSCRVHVIRPEKSFGDFKTATMDFDGAHFRHKFELGYADALKVLKKL